MQSIKKYLYSGDINYVIDLFYYIKDKKQWLNESYDMVSNDISEDQFYKSKFYDYSINTPLYWVWLEYLYENLNSLKTTSETMKKLLSLVKGIDKVEIINDYILSIFINSEFDLNDIEFKTLLNFCNYFIKSKTIDNRFLIEAKHPKEIKDYDFNELYHVTTKYAYEKIKRIGLLPRDKTTIVNHCNRIYFWTSIDNRFLIEAFGRLLIRLYKKYNIKDNDKHELKDIDINDYVILKIDLKSFNEDHTEKLKLFGDPANMNNTAVYTEEPITSKYINIILNYE